MTMKPKPYELLAPVGSKEALIAAVQNGCDAVYLGSTRFSARAFAANFDDDAMAWAITYCHSRGVKLFVTVNTLYRQEELPQVVELVDDLYMMGVDAVIVQDVGLSHLLLHRYPGMELHASTQMFIHQKAGAKFLEDLGFHRVVVDREMSLKEIRETAGALEIPLEGFIHGALCVCYSGQCLMSSLIGGRSGNRGRCAQSCRRRYVLDGEEGYFISPRELSSQETIQDILDAGIYSLKIEGRMKRPEYVATVVGVYDRLLRGVSEQEDAEDLRQAFNRGFTKGLPFGDFGPRFIGKSRPDNRGIPLGRMEKGKVVTSIPLSPEDGLAVRGRDHETVGWTVDREVPAGTEIPVPHHGLADGTVVYRTASAKLWEKARASYATEHRGRPLQGRGRFVVGEKPWLEVSLDEKTVKVVGPEPLTEAKTAPASEESVRVQLDRLGDTPFYWQGLALEVGEQVYIAKSVLNALRREAVEKLIYEKREQLPAINWQLPTYPRAEALQLTASVMTKEQFCDLALEELARVYVPLTILDEPIAQAAKRAGTALWGTLPPVMETPQLEAMMAKVETWRTSLAGVEASDLGSFARLRELGVPVQAAAALHIFNPWAAEFFAHQGAVGYVASRELNGKEWAELCQHSRLPGEVIVYGFAPGMVMRSCPAAAKKGCLDDSHCATCTYWKGHVLTDEKGESFPFYRRDGLTVITNAHPLFLADDMKAMAQSGWAYARLEFTMETEVRPIQEGYLAALKGQVDENFKRKLERTYGRLTRGHYRRGVQ